MKLNDKQAYIDKLNQKFNYKFDYSKFDYVTIDTPTTVICPVHGELLVTPYNHYRSKHGCIKCGQALAAKSKESSTKDFITKARQLHADKYTYDNTVYTGAKDKLVITCPIHGDFKQLASGHLSGYGCNKCKNHGKGRVDMHAPCILYYLNIAGTSLYKIGITTRSIKERYRTSFDKEQFTVVFSKRYSTGREAYEKEQHLLSFYSSLLYSGSPVLSSGNTELFTEDIFKGDYSEYQ